jgi:hypothetical protein
VVREERPLVGAELLHGAIERQIEQAAELQPIGVGELARVLMITRMRMSS